MEEMSVKKCIFMISESLESKNMIECLQSLLSVCPDIKFTSVASNSNPDIAGYRVCFEGTEIMTVLEKRCITVMNKQIAISPPETFLMIHDIDLNEGNKFEHDITTAICEKFGKVLCFDKSAKLSDTTINSFLIVVDVPESKDLNIFSRNGYPQMIISVPTMNKNFKVSIWCRRCRHPGHTLQECFDRPEKPTQEYLREETFQNEIKMNSREQPDQSSIEIARKMPKYSGMVNFPESTDAFALQLGREIARSVTEEGTSIQRLGENSTYELVSRLAGIFNLSNDILSNTNVSGREGDQDPKTVKPDESNTRVKKSKKNVGGTSILSAKEVKKEIPEQTSEQQESKCTQSEAMKTFGNNSSRYIADGNTAKRPYDEDARPFSYDATSTTADDDIQIIESGLTNREETSRDATDRQDSIKKELIIPDQEMPFRSLPVSPLVANKPQLKINLPQPGSSVYSPQQNQMTSCLSDRLQDCINRAYEMQPILDRPTLDAFLIHVKKKSNPMAVASKYTENVQAIKDQLKQILFFYYNTPQTGTKEDTQFIKWLNGLVERFDGTIPRKRKPARKSDGSTPKKKDVLKHIETVRN